MWGENRGAINRPPPHAELPFHCLPEEGTELRAIFLSLGAEGSLPKRKRRRLRRPQPAPPDLPCSSLKSVLSSFSISPRCSSRVSLPLGMAALVCPALLPRQEAHFAEEETSPAVKGHRQKNRGQRRPSGTAALWERLTPGSRLHVPQPQGSEETRRGRAGRGGQV